MDKLVQDMFYLNSSYSKESILKRFEECLCDYGIDNYGIITRAINFCTTLDFDNFKVLEYSYGSHNVLFKYEASFELSKEDTDSLLVLLTSFVIAIENSSLYEKLISKIDNNINLYVGSYQELLVDIEVCKEDYKRYSSPFTLVKILYPRGKAKHSTKEDTSKETIVKIKNATRLNDKIYRDESGILILLKNTDFAGGEKVAAKIKKEIGNIDFGVATWSSSFIAIDLLSEVENYIYLNQITKRKTNESQITKLNKILDIAIFKNDTIVIVSDSQENEEYKKYQCHVIEIDSKRYMVLRNPENINKEHILYTFNYEDIADDVFLKLKDN